MTIHPRCTYVNVYRNPATGREVKGDMTDNLVKSYFMANAVHAHTHGLDPVSVRGERPGHVFVRRLIFVESEQ